jgi:S1-C subfamily serine protease
MRPRSGRPSITLFVVLAVTLLGFPLAACTQASTPTLISTTPTTATQTVTETQTVTSIPTSTTTTPPIEPAKTPETITIPTPNTEISVLVNRVAPAVVRVITDDGMGSGIIMDKLGYVLTNNHVVESSQSIKVVLDDKREYSASVLGRDEIKDLAILKISAVNLPIVTLGNSEKLKLGDEVIAIGYPLDLTGSATISRGIVSAFRIDNEAGLTYIQTDASINPGSSGGAIINSMGEVVGITVMTIRIADDIPIEGMNFAIAIDSTKPIIPKLMAGESVLKPWVTYTKSGTYSIQYPSTWKLSMDSPTGWVDIYGPRSTSITIFYMSGSPGKTMDDILDNYYTIVSNNSLVHVVVSRTDLMWQDEYPARDVTSLQQIDTTKSLTKGRELWVQYKGFFVKVRIHADASEYESYSSIFDTIINSFHLIN